MDEETVQSLNDSRSVTAANKCLADVIVLVDALPDALVSAL